MSNEVKRPYWHVKEKEARPNPKVDAFLADILAVYKKHGLSLAHEDQQGAFRVRPRRDIDEAWVCGAIVEEGVG